MSAFAHSLLNYLAIARSASEGGRRDSPIRLSIIELGSVLAFLVVSGCSAMIDDFQIVDDDTDSSADTDIDTDTDTDTDTDADTDPPSSDDSDSGEAGTDTDSDTDPDAEPGCAHPDVVESCVAGWCTIPAGCFWMGSPDGDCPQGYTDDSSTCILEPGRSQEAGREELHQVTLTRAFEIMSTEVTQVDFTRLMSWNPSHFGPDSSEGYCGSACPVEYVSWYDAAAYANQLSSEAGLAPCYLFSNVECEDATNAGNDYLACMNEVQGGINSASIKLNGVSTSYQCAGYRLPTEAEWEYAARAGSQTAIYASDGNNGTLSFVEKSPLDANLDQIGWYGGNSGAGYSGRDCGGWFDGATSCGPQPVGGKESNSWGLYDTSGNVWEWVWDWYGTFAADAVADPTGPATAFNRVYRGGSWTNTAKECRSAFRTGFTPGERYNDVGFRLARSRQTR